jgi:hypothetical protein
MGGCHLPLPLPFAVILSDAKNPHYFCVSRSESNGEDHGKKSSDKSRHPGFTASISAILRERSQPLICFSRAIASRISANGSK